MDETEENDKIIKTQPLEYEPYGGIGTEFFRCMSFHKNNVAQYLYDSNEEDTYALLLERCVRTAIKMKSEGLTRTDIVCLCTDNHENSCVPFIASMFLGIKVASLDPTLSIEDTSHLLQQVQPTIIFLVSEAIDLIESSLKRIGISCKLVIFEETDEYQSFSDYLTPDDEESNFQPVFVSPDETAVIFFSSGTTGLPKGICQSHYALLAQGVNMINRGYITSVGLYFSSLYWISAALCLSGTILAGCARVIARKFDGHQVWKIIHKYKVSFMFLAPSQASEMCKAGRPDNIDTSNLLCVLTGGGIFSEKQLVYLRDLLPGTHVCQGYGQTEVAGVLTCFKLNTVKDTLKLHYKPTSCGTPVNGIWYKIVHLETEEILGPNQQGELRVKTNFAMNGYYNLDSSEAYDADGWLKTGDICYYDEDLCFYVVDRAKELLKYKSWHIVPNVLENILQTHPSVKKAVVIGIPHEEDGDHPMAVIVLNNDNDDVSAEEIEKYVADRVQDRQRLRAGVKFVKTLPITPSGKVKRRELRNIIISSKI